MSDLSATSHWISSQFVAAAGSSVAEAFAWLAAADSSVAGPDLHSLAAVPGAVIAEFAAREQLFAETTDLVVVAVVLAVVQDWGLSVVAPSMAAVLPLEWRSSQRPRRAEWHSNCTQGH